MLLSPQVVVTDTNTQFIEHIIFIMRNVLENKTEHSAEHLGATTIEGMMLAIVRYALSHLWAISVRLGGG